jgi:hypothetical protein
MNSKDFRNIQEAYLNVYEELKGTGPRLADPYADNRKRLKDEIKRELKDDR